MISRRKLLLATLVSTTAIGAFGAYTFWPAPKGENFTSDDTVAQGVFAHGIASGDPLSDRVIIWTHVVSDRVADVTWEISKTADFSDVIGAGTVQTDADKDWTVKVDVTGLDAGSIYFYRFHFDDVTSPIGKTRTLPNGPVDLARFAVVSCSSWQHGYFNVYDHIAKQDHFDALIHLGDYIYEYGTTEKAGQPKAGPIRLHEPAHEITTLADYRKRLAQYRTDPSLQAVTAKLPLIAIWDDHETANNSYSNGAANHNEDDGVWNDRKAAALQAYFEWLPVREPSDVPKSENFRAFEWGDLATIVALETRLTARDKPLEIEGISEMLDGGMTLEEFNETILFDKDREVLGDSQGAFIADTLKRSKQAGKPWRIVANQVVMGRVATPDLHPHVTQEAMDNIRAKWSGIDDFVRLSGFRLPFALDSWDGYPVARERFYSAVEDAGVNDLLVLTGDAHEYWVNDAGTKMGVEIGTTSVTSSTLQSYLGAGTASYSLLMTKDNNDVRYYNPIYHGYVDLSLTSSKAITDLVAVNTVFSRDYTAFRAAQFTIKPDTNSLSFSNPRGLSPKQWALFQGLA